MRFSFLRQKATFVDSRIIDSPSTFANRDTVPDQQERSIGEIMVVANALKPEQVEAVLEYQKKHGMRFGDAAIALGFTRREEVLWALSQQFDYPNATARGELLHRELHLANDPFSDDVESFRDLRSHLCMTVMQPDQPRRPLAIVSANVGDGKTFIAANLAVAFSQLPGRTLIVDADMRSPRLHKVFGHESAEGLSSILSGRAEANLIRPVGSLPNLYILPVGTVPPNPLELMQKINFRLLLDALSSKFDYVLIDTPAAEHGSDARLIAARTGAALLVSRRNKSEVKPAQKLVAQLTKAQVVMAGVVMNDY